MGRERIGTLRGRKRMGGWQEELDNASTPEPTLAHPLLPSNQQDEIAACPSISTLYHE